MASSSLPLSLSLSCTNLASSSSHAVALSEQRPCAWYEGAPRRCAALWQCQAEQGESGTRKIVPAEIVSFLLVRDISGLGSDRRRQVAGSLVRPAFVLGLPPPFSLFEPHVPISNLTLLLSWRPTAQTTWVTSREGVVLTLQATDTWPHLSHDVSRGEYHYMFNGKRLQ